MKKSILFILPLFAMTIVGCGSKSFLPSGGKDANLLDTVDKFQSALLVSAQNNSIGLKLSNGAVKADMTENIITGSYDYYTGRSTYSIANVQEKVSLDKLNINLGIKNLSQRGMENIKGSASASGNLRLTFNGSGVEEIDEAEKYIGYINESLKANAYLDNGLFYFDFNDGLKNTINKSSAINGAGEIFEGNKYYIDTGLAEVGQQLSLTQLLAMSLAQLDIRDAINDTPSYIRYLITDYVKALSYSNDKYALYANIDVNKVNNIISLLANMPIPLFDQADKINAEAVILFDTRQGITDVKLKVDAKALVTIQEYLNMSSGGQNYYNLTEAELKLPYIDLNYTVDLGIEFLYGSKVSVIELRNKSGYEKIEQGGKQSLPSESERHVTYDEFAYAANNRPNAPQYKRVVIQASIGGVTYSYDSNTGGDTNLLEMANQMNIDSFISTYGKYPEFEYYLSTYHFRAEGYPGEETYLTATFNQYGKLTYYYESYFDGSQYRTNEIQISWFY